MNVKLTQRDGSLPPKCLFANIIKFNPTSDFLAGKDVEGERIPFTYGLFMETQVRCEKIPFPLLIQDTLISVDKEKRLIYVIKNEDKYHAILLDDHYEAWFSPRDREFERYVGMYGLLHMARIIYDAWLLHAGDNPDFPLIDFEKERKSAVPQQESYQNMCVFWENAFKERDRLIQERVSPQ